MSRCIDAIPLEPTPSGYRFTWLDHPYEVQLTNNQARLILHDGTLDFYNLGDAMDFVLENADACPDGSADARICA